MKLFLDTNILIDFLDEKRENNKIAKNFFDLLLEGDHDVVISEDILTTIFYICKKNVERKRLLNFLQMLNEEFSIVNFGGDVIDEAIKLCQKNSKLDFEDVIQSICAESNNCDFIVTNDKNFLNIGITIQSTKDILNHLNLNL